MCGLLQARELGYQVVFEEEEEEDWDDILEDLDDPWMREPPAGAHPIQAPVHMHTQRASSPLSVSRFRLIPAYLNLSPAHPPMSEAPSDDTTSTRHGMQRWRLGLSARRATPAQ